jgi:transcriptional regulator with XRE-family HTH domain
VNETLRHALLRARLTEDDVAARLQVDPKTVRRWLEGRVPYLRHRWALTGLLDADEADLWPEVRAAITARSRPAEIKAVYPHRNAVPGEAWLALFSAAEQEIGVLACSGRFLAMQPGVMGVLAGKGRDGVRVRICLRDPDGPATAEGSARGDGNSAATAGIGEALALFRQLRDSPGIEVRLHRAFLYNSIYRADDQLLVSQHIYGIADEHVPVLYLRSANHDDMVTTYADAFDRIWTSSLPLQ